MTEEKALNSNDDGNYEKQIAILEYKKQIASLESQIRSFENENTKRRNKESDSYRDNVGIVIIGLFVFSLIGYFIYIGYLFRNEEKLIVEGITNHASAAIGLPIAAITSLTLVLLLEEVFGQIIEVKAIGFEFKGAAGPIILWILGFLAITIAIKSVW